MINGDCKTTSAQDFLFKRDNWRERGSSKFLTYIGPALEENLDSRQVRSFIREKKAFGATWNYNYDYAENGPWYRCICDAKCYDESCIESKNVRHNLHRSLKRCTVRQIEYQWLAENGHDVYVKASLRYSNFKPEPRERFRQRMLDCCNVQGAEAFGVFVGDKLVAYLTLFVCGQRVWGDTAAFDPEYSNAYPMYALYYKVAQYYLNEKGYKEFDRGTRPLVHQTNIDDFLLRLGYRKSYCRMGLYLALPVRIVLKVAAPFMPVLKPMLPSRYYAILEGLLMAQHIAKVTSKK
jgi:hypothetical protein